MHQPQLQRVKLDIVDWIEDTGGPAYGDAIPLPYPGSDVWIHAVETHISELRARSGLRRLEGSLIAQKMARIRVRNARCDLVGVQCSPAGAPYSDFRERWSRREGRGSCRKDAIDAEVLMPILTGDCERSANENCVFARCIDKQLTIETLRAIDKQRGDESSHLIPLHCYGPRLVYFRPEPRTY